MQVIGMCCFYLSQVEVPVGWRTIQLCCVVFIGTIPLRQNRTATVPVIEETIADSGLEPGLAGLGHNFDSKNKICLFLFFDSSLHSVHSYCCYFHINCFFSLWYQSRVIANYSGCNTVQWNLFLITSGIATTVAITANLRIPVFSFI